LQYFDSIERAYSFVDSEDMETAIIFIHSGMYLTEYLFVDTNVTMIGAAPGNVIDSVIIERGTESTITFVEGAKEAYLGYVTLKVRLRKMLNLCSSAYSSI
jgi:F-box protein 11